MKYKRIVVTMLVVFPLLVGLACNLSLPKFLSPKSDSDSIEDIITEIVPEIEVETPTEEVVQPVQSEFQELVKMEQTFWKQDEKDVFVAFLFQNSNSDVVFEDLEYTISLVDSAGEEIKSAYDTLPLIYPNEIVGVTSRLYLSDDDPEVNDVNISWEYAGTAPANGVTNPYTVDRITFWEDDSYPMVTATINNLDSATVTDLVANIICYGTGGEIVGVGNSFIPFVPANDSVGLSDFVDIFGQVASVEVFFGQGFDSTRMENEDIWSEISVVKDYFYENEFGSIYGGLIIQNNLPITLKSSDVFVTFYDAEGNVTSTASDYISVLLPNETMGVIPWVFSPPEGAVTSEYDVLVLPGTHEDGYEMSQNPFVVNDAILTGDYKDTVKVSFTSNFSKTITDVDVIVLLLDTDGGILGGGSDWFSDPISPNSAIEVDVWVSREKDRTVDRIEVWITPNFFTKFD